MMSWIPIITVTWRSNSPERLFKSGPLEKTVSGALRTAIETYGPITHETNGSASKRVSAAVRGFLQNFNATALQKELLEQEKKRLKAEIKKPKETNASLRKQRDNLLEKLRNGEPL